MFITNTTVFGGRGFSIGGGCGVLKTATGYPLTLTNTLAKAPQSIAVSGASGGVGDYDSVKQAYKIPILINQTPMLPSGYTKLEYVESTGTQYINTGITATANTGMSIEYMYTGEGSAAISGIYRPGSTRRDVFFISSADGTTSSTAFVAHRGATTQLYLPQISLNTKYSCKINYKNDAKINFNNDFITDVGSASLLNAIIPIFARLNASDDTIAISKSRIYYVEFTEGNTVSHKFIPAKRNSDNEIGMYDTVTGIFHTNQGTGSFSGGAKTINLYSDRQLTSAVFRLVVYPKTKEAKLLNLDLSGLQDWEQDWKIPKADELMVTADTQVKPSSMGIKYYGKR